jgi:hypothetical protein
MIVNFPGCIPHKSSPIPALPLKRNTRLFACGKNAVVMLQDMFPVHDSTESLSTNWIQGNKTLFTSLFGWVRMREKDPNHRSGIYFFREAMIR